MGLKAYQKKRTLTTSKEPPAKKSNTKARSLAFVVQKHAARKLHYDLRLECDGVLKSWAIPKGPSLNPNDKRLAIMVEDHPFEYRHFKGTIPKGHYGAGTVQIWDKGTYTSTETTSSPESEQTIKKGLKKGEIFIVLKGKKLKGEFALVKLKKGDVEDKHWLLIKKKDSFSSSQKIEKEDYLSTPMPHHIKPMLATLADHPFDHKDWFFELKWDGFRAIAEIEKKNVKLYSRNFQSYSKLFPDIVKELQALDTQVILDGEIVILDKKGKPQFQLLQNYTHNPQGILRYYVFDLLYLENKDLRMLPLIERKQLLKAFLKQFPTSLLHYSDHIDEKGKSFFKKAEEAHLEGIIAKYKESSYQQKRSKDWLKIKIMMRQEAIICGWTNPKGSRKKFGALVLGVKEKGNLRYIGHVGTGFNHNSLQAIYHRLLPLSQKHSPFKITPKTNDKTTWVKPILLCEVSFREWTEEGYMRQPVFMGIREDKKPKEVIHEIPVSSFKQMIKADTKVTNRDKIYWPKEKYTKGDLLDYYQSVSSFILPYLKGRPEVLHRYPEGISGKHFYQKDIASIAPNTMSTTTIHHDETKATYLLIEDLNSLVYAVNLGCIELHPFLSRVNALKTPDYLVIDLDPQKASFEKVIETAQILHEILEEIGAKSYCKTSGKTGLHIYVPLGTRYTYDQALEFAHLISIIAHQRSPMYTSLDRSPTKREKKVYLDYLQNRFGQAIVAPYAVRPLPQAPVSTPLIWSEVKKGLDPFEFTIKTIGKRLKKLGDVFKGVLKEKIDLIKCLKQLEKIV